MVWPASGCTCVFVALAVGLINASAVPGGASGNSFQLGILIPWSGDWVLGPSMGAAVGVALTEVERRGILPGGFTVDWEWKDTECSRLTGKKSVKCYSDG